MAIAFINSTAFSKVTAASTWSIATHSSVEGGAAFIVGLGLHPGAGSPVVSTITDNAGNAYLKAVQRQTTAANLISAELWYAANISSASTRLSITLSTVSSGSIVVGQFRGISTANALLATDSTYTVSLSTVFTCGALTPAEANALVIAFSRTQQSTMSPTALDGGQSEWCSTGQAVRSVGGYVIQGAASTFTGQWRSGAGTSTGLTRHTGVMAAFSDTASAPPLSAGFFPSFCLMGVQ